MFLENNQTRHLNQNMILNFPVFCVPMVYSEVITKSIFDPDYTCHHKRLDISSPESMQTKTMWSKINKFRNNQKIYIFVINHFSWMCKLISLNKKCSSDFSRSHWTHRYVLVCLFLPLYHGELREIPLTAHCIKVQEVGSLHGILIIEGHVPTAG